MSRVNLRITTVTREIEFTEPSKICANTLFLYVCKNIGIRESWYFGLHFLEKGDKMWIDVSKKKMSIYKAWAQKLLFTVKYYPEDVTVDLIEDLTRKYFFLHIRSDILSDKMYCPPDTCVLLASYAAQVKHGDFEATIDISNEMHLPERVYKQHKLDKDIFLESVISLWKKHSGLLREEAILEYLKLTQNLEMFGVHYFTITNAKGTEVLLGVHPLGLNIYTKDDKLNPIILFPWSEIGKLNFRGKKFIIKPTDKAGKDFVFLCHDPRTNKKIFNLGIGYHQLYIKRRKPDSLEIIQMKESAGWQRKIIEMQRDKLREEVRVREQLEKNYKLELKKLHDQINITQHQLRESQETIRRLNQQLADIEAAKKQLEERQNELQMMMERLEKAKTMEAAEKAALEEEIIAKQREVQRIREEVELKDLETQRLQEEVELEKRKQEELRLMQLEENARKEQEQRELEELEKAAQSELPELAQVNEQLSQQLKDIQDKLEESRNATLETNEDKIHRENIRDGKDKYKTLREIRKGNTTRRVDLFENL